MPLHFELVTPERLVRSEDVHMVVVPGSEGEFGVMEGHAPFMSTLRNGDIAIYRSSMNDVPERIAVEGGFAEVSDRGLTILAEKAEV
jgi:F-type H+-transporting ATPase subunit epsilon